MSKFSAVKTNKKVDAKKLVANKKPEFKLNKTLSLMLRSMV